MGLLDSFKGALGQAEASAMPTLISEGLAKTGIGNLQGLVDQLQQGPLATQVQSWLGSGNNLPVTSDQLKSALNNDHVRQLAQHFGVDPDAALNLLAQHLPTAVAQASAQGKVSAAS